MCVCVCVWGGGGVCCGEGGSKLPTFHTLFLLLATFYSASDVRARRKEVATFAITYIYLLYMAWVT